MIKLLNLQVNIFLKQTNKKTTNLLYFLLFLDKNNHYISTYTTQHTTNEQTKKANQIKAKEHNN